MTKYKCGHKIDTIIMNDSIMGYVLYGEWSKSVGVFGTREICWDCWNKQLNGVNNLKK